MELVLSTLVWRQGSMLTSAAMVAQHESECFFLWVSCVSACFPICSNCFACFQGWFALDIGNHRVLPCACAARHLPCFRSAGPAMPGIMFHHHSLCQQNQKQFVPQFRALHVWKKLGLSRLLGNCNLGESILLKMFQQWIRGYSFQIYLRGTQKVGDQRKGRKASLCKSWLCVKTCCVHKFQCARVKASVCNYKHRCKNCCA